jgi:hypothetical protein
MRTLVCSAVCGLVPIPPMFGTVINNKGNLRSTSDDVDLWQTVLFPDVTERMVTKDEVARIRKQLEEIGKRAA